MLVFICYPKEFRPQAEALAAKIRSGGHDTFYDEESLPAGRTYDDKIRAIIQRDCDLFVFFISPESLSEGRYTLTELAWVKERWPNPNGRILPVMVSKVEYTDIDYYLRSVKILEPKGNFETEVAQQVFQLLETTEYNSSIPNMGSHTYYKKNNPYAWRHQQIRFLRDKGYFIDDIYKVICGDGEASVSNDDKDLAYAIIKNALGELSDEEFDRYIPPLVVHGFSPAKDVPEGFLFRASTEDREHDFLFLVDHNIIQDTSMDEVHAFLQSKDRDKLCELLLRKRHTSHPYQISDSEITIAACLLTWRDFSGH